MFYYYYFNYLLLLLSLLFTSSFTFKQHFQKYSINMYFFPNSPKAMQIPCKSNLVNKGEFRFLSEF